MCVGTSKFYTAIEYILNNEIFLDFLLGNTQRKLKIKDI